MVRKKRYDYYSATISGLLITILYIGLSKAGRLTTLRLFHDYFIGETTTIGYDYSRRNATTIADLYWLSDESPKRDTAAAVNGSAPPASGLPRRVKGAGLTRRALTVDRGQIASLRAGMVCGMLHCLA